MIRRSDTFLSEGKKKGKKLKVPVRSVKADGRIFVSRKAEKTPKGTGIRVRGGVMQGKIRQQVVSTSEDTKPWT